MSNLCPVCCIEFKEDTEFIPKILNCGDTICLNCLNKNKKNDKIICPICTQEINDLENIRANNLALYVNNTKICKISLNEFNSETTPKVLKCGNTICLNCLKKSFNESNDEILCPICKESHKENLESIPVNKLILKLIKEDELLLNTKILNLGNDVNNLDYEFSIGLIGDVGVGKTYITNYFLNEKPLQNYTKKNEYEFNSKLISIKNKNIKIKLFDTLGQEAYKNFNISLLKNVDAILIIFSLTQKDALNQAKVWYTQYTQMSDIKGKVIYLIGNKSDDEKNRVIKNEVAINLANELKVEYFETSAINGNNINKIFLKICLNLMEIFKVKGKNQEKKYRLVRDNNHKINQNQNQKKSKCS